MKEKNNASSCACDCSPKEAALCQPKNKGGKIKGSPMDTQIFRLGLGVLPTSVYIIISAIQADGLKPSFSSINGRWNEKPQALDSALSELEDLKIIVRHKGENENDPIFLTNPPALWVPNNEG